MTDENSGDEGWNSNLHAWRQRRRKSHGVSAGDNEFPENSDNSPRGIFGKTTWSDMKTRRGVEERDADPLADIFDADGMSKSPRRPLQSQPRIFTAADAVQRQKQHTSVFTKERPSDVFNTKDMIKQQAKTSTAAADRSHGFTQNNEQNKPVNRVSSNDQDDDDFALFEKAEQTFRKKYGKLKDAEPVKEQPKPKITPQKPENNFETKQSSYSTDNYVPPKPVEKKSFQEKRTPTENKKPFEKPVSEKTRQEISPEDKQKQLVNRRQKFTNKFSMWENMGKQVEKPSRPVSFNPYLNRTPSQSENLVLKPQTQPQSYTKSRPVSSVFEAPKPAPVKNAPKFIQLNSSNNSHPKTTNIQKPPTPNTNIRSSSGVSVKSGISAKSGVSISSQSNSNPVNTFTGLRSSSEHAKRKMKIIIQQKPNLEGGFGFKLNIGPGRTILVERVVKRGSADKCGLKNGDEVDFINDHPCQVFSLRELDDIVKSAVYSGNISLMIQRISESNEGSKECDKENYGGTKYSFKPKVETEEKANPFKSNSSLNTNSVGNDLENKLNNVVINDENNSQDHHSQDHNSQDNHSQDNHSQETGSQDPVSHAEEKWYQELGLYDTQNIQRIQTLDLRNNKIVTQEAQNLIQPVLEAQEDNNLRVREKTSNNSGGSFYSSESGPTGSGGSTGNQKQISPKSKFQAMDERFEESIKSEEKELMKKRHQRELDEQRRRQEYEDKVEEEGRLRRMELEAKEAEQRARRNREKYDGQMQKIEQELKLEEARLAQVRGERVQAEQKLKQRYNYNQDYSVIHPGQSQIHEVPDIPSPSQRSTHNRPTTDHQTEPRYYFQENKPTKFQHRDPPQYQEKSGSVENILNDPSLQATLL